MGSYIYPRCTRMQRHSKQNYVGKARLCYVGKARLCACANVAEVFESSAHVSDMRVAANGLASAPPAPPDAMPLEWHTQDESY